jgi:hypothetical protein
MIYDYLYIKKGIENRHNEKTLSFKFTKLFSRKKNISKYTLFFKFKCVFENNLDHISTSTKYWLATKYWNSIKWFNYYWISVFLMKEFNLFFENPVIRLYI